MILVDTSVLIDLLRGTDTPATRELERLERGGVPYHVPMICAQAVLQGARDDREWARLHRSLSTQRLLEPQSAWAVYVEAARIAYDTRRAGFTIRSAIDCLVAAQVLEQAGTLLHSDRDYDRIAQVRPLRTWP